MKFRLLSIFAAALSLVAFNACTPEEELGDPMVALDKTTLDFTAQGGTMTVSLTATLDWTIDNYTDDVKAWLTVTPDHGTAAKDPQTITIKAAPNALINRTVSLDFKANVINHSVLTINQAGEKGETLSATVAEFLQKKDTETEYVLTGKVGVISNSEKYYGFYLKDATGEICCPFPKEWTTKYGALIHTGDQVSVKGKYEYFADKSQDQLADGVITAHTPASVDNIQNLSVKDFIAKADPYTLYRLVGTVEGEVDKNYYSFTLKDDTGTIKVYNVNIDDKAKSVKKAGLVTLRGAYQAYTSGGSTTHEVVDATIETFEEKMAVITSVEGIVVALSRLSYLVQTNEGYTYCYNENGAGEVKVGDKVSVSGESSSYNGVPQIANPEAKVLSSGNTFTLPDPTVLDGAALDAYDASKHFTFVKVTGDLTSTGTETKYYNLAVNGATTRKGSLAYPIDVDAFVNKTVDVTGFYVGISGSIYYNILVTDIKESATQTEVEKLSHPLEPGVSWTLGAQSYDNTSSGSSKQSATVNKVKVDNLLKLSSSSKAGSATLNIPEGKTKIGFYAGGWKTTQAEEQSGKTMATPVKLKVGDKTIDVKRNEGCTGNPPFNITFSDKDNYYEVEVSAGSVTVTCDERVVLIGITAY